MGKGLERWDFVWRGAQARLEESIASWTSRLASISQLLLLRRSIPRETMLQLSDGPILTRRFYEP